MIAALAGAALLGAALAQSAAAQALDPAALPSGGMAMADAAVDGDTLRLRDGRIVRLAGLLAPKSGALARAATAHLNRLVAGRQIGLYHAGRRMDRHGDVMAQVWLVQIGLDAEAGGGWLQAAMLARGLARVFGAADMGAPLIELLRIEAAARAAGRGLWADAAYRVRAPEDVAAAADSFQLVEGRILAVDIRRERAYINFGDDHATDFTLLIDEPVLRLFKAAGRDIQALAGLRVRVRGWIETWRGPMIDIAYPEQIEVLP